MDLRERLRPAMERIEEQRRTGIYPPISRRTWEIIKIIFAGDQILDAMEQEFGEMRRAG
jgi:hypothetical protein